MTKQTEALKPWHDIADAAGILRSHNHMGLADRLLRHAEALSEESSGTEQPQQENQMPKPTRDIPPEPKHLFAKTPSQPAQPQQELVLQDQLNDALDSLAFYKRRVEALQRWQSKMRDPERTIVCDIIANGCTFKPEGDRYKQLAQPSKPWSGLTVGDKESIASKAEAAMLSDKNLSWRRALMDETEATLKEKNT